MPYRPKSFPGRCLLHRSPMMMTVGAQYGIVAALLVLAIAIGALVIGAGRWFVGQPRSPHDDPPFEYGSRTAHKTWVQFRVRYAVLALLFVAFDMEMVYMFPWAVAFKRLGLVAFLDMFVFIAILAAAIGYAWKEGAFDWER